LLQRDELVLYKDKNFRNSFVVQDFPDVEPGDTKQKTAYLSNDTNNEIIQIGYETKDPDVRMEELPDRLSGGAWQPCKIVFSPSIDRTIPLNTSITIVGKKRETFVEVIN